MKNMISDKDFCNQFTLAGDDGKTLKTLLAKNQHKAAAIHLAQCLFAKPFAHPIVEKHIPAMASLIAQEIPEHIQTMETLANKFWLKDVTAIPDNASAHDTFQFHVPNITQRERGIAVYSLCRLFHLTGKKHYLTAAMKMMRDVCGQHGDYPQGSPIGYYGWHPHTEQKSYNQKIAHIAQEFNMMLPFIRLHCSDADKVYVLKVLWTVADLAYRAFRKDQSFNLTLHFTTACNETAMLFPQCKQSKTWVTWSQSYLQEFYQGNGISAGGYFREGTAYQRVNHHLLELNYHFMKAAGHTVPKKLSDIISAAHQLNADICGPDGFPPLIGDTTPSNPHEHWLHTHEALHLGAALENKRSYKDKAGTPFNRKANERNMWDMGLTGLKRYLKMPLIADKNRSQKPADHGVSGFQILGCGKHTARHFGALMYTQDHNHAHFDIGSIHIYSKGRNLISDPSKASYATTDGKDEAAHSHSLAMLPRFSPAGPRLHSQTWAKTVYVKHQATSQACSMEHKLYDGFRMQRSMVLIDKSKETGDKSFWVVFDKITPEHRHPLGLHELIDTSFHFNAVETHLGVHGLQCWSQHDPKKKTALRYPETDTHFAGPGAPFNIQEHREGFEMGDSAANIQVAGFSLDGVEFSLQESASHTCEFGGRVQRPAALFRYRGPLPAVFAYVLVPFDGVKMKKPFDIQGSLNKKEFTCTVRGKKLHIKNPFTNTIQVRCS